MKQVIPAPEALQGTRLLILTGLLVHRSMLKKDLEIFTGKSSDTVQKDVEILHRMELVAKEGRGWVLTDQALHLFSRLSQYVSQQITEHTHGEKLPTPKFSDFLPPVVVFKSLNNVNQDQLTTTTTTESANSENFSESASTYKTPNVLRALDRQTPAYKNLLRVLTMSKVFPNIRPKFADRIYLGEIDLTCFDILGMLNQLLHSKGIDLIGAVMKTNVETGAQPEDRYRPPTADLEKAIAWVRCKNDEGRKSLELEWETAWRWVCPECEDEIDGPEMFMPYDGFCYECGTKMFRRDWDQIKAKLATDFEDGKKHDAQH